MAGRQHLGLWRLYHTASVLSVWLCFSLVATWISLSGYAGEMGNGKWSEVRGMAWSFQSNILRGNGDTL
jgi:hypothetical protein